MDYRFLAICKPYKVDHTTIILQYFLNVLFTKNLLWRTQHICVLHGQFYNFNKNLYFSCVGAAWKSQLIPGVSTAGYPVIKLLFGDLSNKKRMVQSNKTLS